MKCLVMDNRVFIVACIVVGLLSLLGSVLIPMIFTGLVYYRYSKKELESYAEKYGYEGEVEVLKL